MASKQPPPRTAEQLADAARLKALFKEWQHNNSSGAYVSQAEAADALGFGQSALSQYLRGAIPLNVAALTKFCDLLGVKPEAISPSIAEAEARRAAVWHEFESAALEVMAREFRARSIEVSVPGTAASLPEWIAAARGDNRLYRPDLVLKLPDGSMAFVEVKGQTYSRGPDDEALLRLQGAHPRDFLVLIADMNAGKSIDQWLAQRAQLPAISDLPPSGGLPVKENDPAHYRIKNRRPVWVVGRTQGGLPERLWDDGGQPVGATDQFADVATSDDHAFACRVVGDSMVPRYMPGEYALVEPSVAPEPEDDVLVRLATGETMLKRLLGRRSGIRLGSYNSQEVMTFREEEISWMYYVAHPIPARRIRQRVDEPGLERPWGKHVDYRKIVVPPGSPQPQQDLERFGFEVTYESEDDQEDQPRERHRS